MSARWKAEASVFGVARPGGRRWPFKRSPAACTISLANSADSSAAVSVA